MKIAVNSCYGGFSVSKEVADKLKKKGHDIGTGSNTSFRSTTGDIIVKCSYHIYNETFNIISDNYQEYRSHPDLIEAIESSDNPSGALAKIRIVDVPDDVNYEIEEYDGIESVREVSRSW